MRAMLALRPLVKKSIDSDIASRTHAHQARVAQLKAARLQHAIEPGASAPAPLVLLAHGDSWFDYPLKGNDLTLNSTDIIAQLQTMGDTHPLILNISHYGDATSEEMSLTRQQRTSGVPDPGTAVRRGFPSSSWRSSSTRSPGPGTMTRPACRSGSPAISPVRGHRPAGWQRGRVVVSCPWEENPAIAAIVTSNARFCSRGIGARP